MQLQLIDLKNLPKTNVLDGTPVYANPFKIIRKLFLKRLELCLNLLENQNGNILDIGCGSGIILPSLSVINGMIVGLDIHKYLHRTKKYLKKNAFHSIHLIQADAHYLPFRRRIFKSVLMISILDHLKKPLLALNQLSKTVDFNGKIIFSFHISSIFSELVLLLWTVIFIFSYSIIFHNFHEIFSNLFQPNLWRHLHSDSILRTWIEQTFLIRRTDHLPSKLPVYIAILCKKFCDSKINLIR